MSNATDNRPPDQLDGADVVCFALLAGLSSSAETTHRIAGDVVADFSRLCIVRYPGEDSYYLFYCDDGWSVVTDTFHLKLEDAKHQAEYEYPGVSDRWIDYQTTA